MNPQKIVSLGDPRGPDESPPPALHSDAVSADVLAQVDGGEFVVANRVLPRGPWRVAFYGEPVRVVRWWSILAVADPFRRC